MGIYVGDKRYALYVGSTRRKVAENEPLPYDAQIEYLGSTGTQYIDIPLTVAVGQYLEAGGEMISSYTQSASDFILSAYPDSQFSINMYSQDASNITYATCVGNNAASGGITVKAGFKTSLAVSTTFKRVEETITEQSRPLTAAISNFRLFISTRGGTGFPVKICSFYIIVGENKIYDFIPVRIGSVGYLYDKISGQFFGNDGTGEFVLGSDINSSTYIQSGLIARWDGIENIGIGQHSDSATTWVDLTGNEYDFVLKNTAAFDSKSLITCSDFSRAASCSQVIPYANNITQEIVLQIESLPTATRYNLFRLGESYGGMLMRGMSYQFKSSQRGWMPKTNSVMTTSDTNKPLSTYSLATVYNGTGRDTRPKLFMVNNVQLTNWGGDGNGSSGDMYISQSSSYGFYGKVYAIRIYNRELEAYELAHNFEIDKKRFNLVL